MTDDGVGRDESIVTFAELVYRDEYWWWHPWAKGRVLRKDRVLRAIGINPLKYDLVPIINMRAYRIQRLPDKEPET